MKLLTEDEFETQFTIVPDADGETIRPIIHGVQGPKDVDPESKYLWTILDVEGNLYAVNGLHYVNRFGYILTEEAWTEDIEAVYHACSDDGDDEDDVSLYF